MKQDRGMMKWMPYKSLPEQDDWLFAMETAKARRPMPVLSEDEREELDRFFLTLLDGDRIVVTVYANGFQDEMEGDFHGICPETRTLFLSGIPIKIDKILHARLAKDDWLVSPAVPA